MAGLDAAVVEEALPAPTPHVAEGGTSRRSAAYLRTGAGTSPFAGALPPPAEEPEQLDFDTDEVRFVRAFVSEWASRAEECPAERTMDLVLAVSEVATNSVVHGGGSGTLHAWQENGSLMCEVQDIGRLQHPLAGRERTGRRSDERTRPVAREPRARPRAAADIPPAGTSCGCT